jgi:hypothetical protein
MHQLTKEIMALYQDTSLPLPEVAARVDKLLAGNNARMKAALRVARGYVRWFAVGEMMLPMNAKQAKTDLKTIDNALEG